MLLLALAAAACSDSSGTPTTTTQATPIVNPALIVLAPKLTATASYVAAHSTDFPSRAADSVHVVLRDSPDSTILVTDTTIFSNPGAGGFIRLNVPVFANGKQFVATMDYRRANTTVYHGDGLVQSYPVDSVEGPTPTVVVINYVASDARLKSIAVSPATFALNGAAAIGLNVVATDSSGVAVSPPIAWTSSDTTIATVSSAGVVQARNKRGTVTITATAPTGIVGTATGSVTP